MARIQSSQDVVSRTLPHDLEVERAVLSALLHENHALHEVLGVLKPEDFYHPAHQQLYRSMVALQDENLPVDLLTLNDYLTQQKTLDLVGGSVYLAEIWDHQFTAANVAQYARMVRDKALRRSLISAAGEVLALGYESAEEAERVLDQAESRIFELSNLPERQSFQSLEHELGEAMNYVEDLMERGGEPTGVATGFRDLDKMTGGLQPGELVVIAARPSMGKTALALNIARNAALANRKRVAIFSLEMTKRALALRLLSAEARVDLSNFHRGFGNVADHKKLVRAAGALANADVWIDDSGMITILEIKAKCRRLHRERPLDLVMLDYLQLAHTDERAQNKNLEIAQISHGLKALAKELDIPVVALSQLNRGPEQRDPDKRRPNMGDLRESGAIEQDADVIAFIYRDFVYNRDEEKRNDAELIVAKQRNGPTGVVHLFFAEKFAQFRDLADAPGDGVVQVPPAGGSFAGDLPDLGDEDDTF